MTEMTEKKKRPSTPADFWKNADDIQCSDNGE
jgi:hypothetical protein